MASDKTDNLNGPDAFQVQAYGVMDKVARNSKPLWIIGGAILALLIGGYGWKYFNHNRTEKLQNAVSEVDTIFEGEMKKYTEAREALEKKRDGVVAKLPAPAEGQPPVETPEVAAINTQIKALKPDHTASSAKYQEFYKANPKTPEGLAAGLKHAAFAAEKGDLDAAKAELQPIVADSKKLNLVHIQALLLLISIDEDKADFDSAIKNADDLVASVGPELMPRALLTKGQAQFLKKDFPGAKVTLEKIVNDHGATPEAERARGLLSLIPA
ncbi:MAG: tetratricopeptide repeat protein [Proteobacteria bacterium]|nr:MAG: tetratricopeptide repeat protein [Pseudomonadota bacterium]